MASGRSRGDRLIMAGVIVTLVGIGIVVVHTLAVPREWTTLLVGLAMIAAGLARRALRTGDGS
jgi:hypothetical protein